MNYEIQVVTLPVSDVDQARTFYTQQAGFTLDVDYHPSTDFRVVQLTPPGSGHRDYASVTHFADPDGSTWILQEIGFQRA